jgi:glyoxalase family protein
MAQFKTTGFHHVTMVTRDATANLAFYRDLLGFPLVKKTVNFDRPDTYHLYYGRAGGAPGTLLTFFEWPQAPRGVWGVGGIHHIALSTRDEQTQLKWKRWLTSHGVAVSGPLPRGYFKSIYFTDPDGQILEIATEGPGFAIDEPADALGQRLIEPDANRLPGGRDEAAIRALTYPEPIDRLSPDMTLDIIHHVTGFTDDLTAAHEFYTGTLGLSLVKQSLNQDDPDTKHFFWANYDGATVRPASDMTMFGWSPRSRHAREGVGQTHHVAFRAADEQQLGAWREELLGSGHKVSDIKDRNYFKSIYYATHDGLIIEIATDGPGFAVDEDANSLGQSLRLPAWLESRRAEIETNLQPLS